MNFDIITLNQSTKIKKNCYMDTDSNVIYIKTKDFYRDIADDVKKWFDSSNYGKDDNRPLLIGWNKKNRSF